MIRLIYVSKALSAFPAGLKDILNSSRKNNVALGITGALCLLDGVYLQYLEGPTIAVEDLYRRIAVDPRHTESRLLERHGITERLFTSWSMALVTWNEETRAIFGAFSAAEKPDLYSLTGKNAASTFEALARSSNWLELKGGGAGAANAAD